jgi:hypothetical protein
MSFWKSNKKAQDFDLVQFFHKKKETIWIGMKVARAKMVLDEMGVRKKGWDQVIFVNILLHTQGQGCDESMCDLEGHVGTKAMKN